MVNSGWVRLLAPYTPRGGVKDPGKDLPLALPADKNLAFMVFPEQAKYIPFLQSIYPGGGLIPYRHDPDGLITSIYRISQGQWADFRRRNGRVEREWPRPRANLRRGASWLELISRPK